MIWVTFLKGKTKHSEKFKNFKSLVENECGHKIKCLRFDNGGELTSKYFNQFCEENGIQRQFSVSRTLQQNRITKRKNRIVQETSRTMLFEVVVATIHLINKDQLRVNSDKTPYELWKGIPTPMEYFRVFGSKCYIKIKEDNLGKFNTRINEGIFWDISIVKEYINVITRA